MNSMDDFLRWEQTTRDVLDFKKVYVDMAGDLLAGLMLSELVYWHLPANDGKSKLRVQHEGQWWVASRRYEWWERTRMTPRQADRAADILVKKGLIDKRTFKFDGEPTVHYAINGDEFLRKWDQTIATPVLNPFLPKSKQISPVSNPLSPTSENDVTCGGSPLTEITAKNTNIFKGFSVLEKAEEPKPVKGKNGKQPPIKEDEAHSAALDEFVCALGFQSLPWNSNPDWTRMVEYITAAYEDDPSRFRKYAELRSRSGWLCMQNHKIRAFPKQFMDAGWPREITMPEKSEYVDAASLREPTAFERRIDEIENPSEYVAAN